METKNVDPEIASIAGPQLVVPVKNARYALNATNARWGSLYDALYGSDVIEPVAASKGYDAERGGKVINYCRDLLDQIVPLSDFSHKDATQYLIDNGQLVVSNADGASCGLQRADQFVGFTGDKAQPTSVLLRNNQLHIEIVFDSSGVIGKDDHAGIQDIILESAVTTIQDCEDSVAAVDGEEASQSVG